MTAHPLPEIEVKLNASDPDIQRYVFALMAENLKLQKQIAKYQAAQVTLNNRIVALEQEIKENRREFHLTINP
jgi:CII-binding regulator of phage lambda lysogenization HflD